jgi:hypothetical protein
MGPSNLFVINDGGNLGATACELSISNVPDSMKGQFGLGHVKFS